MVTYQATCKRFEELETVESSKVQLTDSLDACREDQHIVDLLTENQLYDTDRLLTVDIEQDYVETNWVTFSGNLTDFVLLTIEEIDLINTTLYDLYQYQGKLFTENLCKDLSSPRINKIHYATYMFMYDVLYKIHHCDESRNPLYVVCCTGMFVVREIDQLKLLERPIHQFIDIIKQKVPKLDALLGTDKRSLGDTIKVLIHTIKHTEKFIRERGSDFINTIGQNITISMQERVDHFRNMTLNEIKHKVGSCAPLAYIQDRGTKYACRQLIDPIVSM